MTTSLLSVTNTFPVEIPKTSPKHKGMTLLATIYSILCLNSAGFIYSSFLTAVWTPEGVTSVIGACSALFAALVAGYIAIINARTRVKIEEHRALSEKNQQILQKVEKEVIKNTAATDQEKVRVEASTVRVEALTRAIEEKNQ